jgi:hypothetical protein
MPRKATALVLALMAAGSIAAPAARADVTQRLAHAREQHHRALQQAQALEDALDGLLVRYEAVARKAGHAAIRLVDRSRAVEAADQALADARAEMRAHIRTVYELGPASMLAAFLSAETLTDISIAHEYTSRALTFDAQLVDELRRSEAMLASRQQSAEDAQARLEGQRRHLTRLLAEMRYTINTARRLADRFGLQVRRLEAQQQAVDEAAAQQTGLAGLSVGATGADQSSLLALLGPTDGRTCGTPDGLTDTGQSFSGNASWYGWDFAGQSTADGAIFDPRLFTAANRWLPFGTFLRVHYGGKCAVVLVNDRGPFVDDRVIDLSMAAAEYLGVGVSSVTADILVPTNGVPG